jgi:putative peptide zinc metalloprotease protein
MLVRKGIVITPYNQSQWVLSTDEGRSLILNEATHRLFNVLSLSNTIEEAREVFNNQFNLNIDMPTFLRVVYERLGGYNIIENDITSERSVLAPEPYHIPVFKADWVHTLAQPFAHFYHVTIFLFLIILTSFQGIYLYHVSIKEHLSAVNTWGIISILILSMLIQPLGYIVGCLKHGLKHEGIWIEFWGILPQFRTKITNIWSLPKQQRIDINVGGIFIQLLLSIVLFNVYGISHYYTFLIASVIPLLIALGHIYPFIKSDGYWLLIDWVETPNLIEKSQTVIRKVYQQGIRASLNPKEWRYFVYGITPFIISISILGYIALTKSSAIGSYLSQISDLSNVILRGAFTIQSLSTTFLWATVFYGLLGYVIVRLVQYIGFK